MIIDACMLDVQSKFSVFIFLDKICIVTYTL